MVMLLTAGEDDEVGARGERARRERAGTRGERADAEAGRPVRERDGAGRDGPRGPRDRDGEGDRAEIRRGGGRRAIDDRS